MAKDHAYATLDGLRGVAAISVVIFHYSENLGWQLLPNAYLAVDFFFMLSGFVIAHAYEARLQSGQTVAEFMQRRLMRLYPLYWLGTTFPLVVIAVARLCGESHPSGTQAIVSYVLGILFLPTPSSVSVFSGRAFPLNVPAWSLALEVGVNAIYAVIARHLTTPRLAMVALIGALALVSAAVTYDSVGLGYIWPTYWGGWIRACALFFAGVLAFRMFGPSRQPTLPPFVALLLTLAMLAVFACRYSGTAFGLCSALILFPAILWVGAQVRLNGAAQKLATWCGAISYALYITHEPIFDALWVLCRLNHWHARDAYWPNLIGWAFLALVVAWILDFAYDLPVRAFLTRKLAHRPLEVHAAPLKA